MARRFDWDKRKATSNAKKHGVTFDEAMLAFDDPFALIEVDMEHSEDELREKLIGRTKSVLVVIFTERETNDGTSVLRIIGARKATKKEKEAYEAQRAI